MNITLEGNDLILTNEIIERADQLDILDQDKISLLMDLNLAHSHYNLRLYDLLNADNDYFVHDIKGIQRNIDRENYRFRKSFLPRYKGLTK